MINIPLLPSVRYSEYLVKFVVQKYSFIVLLWLVSTAIEGREAKVLKDIKMSHTVFVYGTLKRNEPNHHWLTNPDNGKGKFIGEGRTATKYPLVIATRYNIPFILYSPGKGHHIKGEIYEVDEKMLSNLDILEDHPNYYIREQDDIQVDQNNKNDTVKCWVYFLKKFREEMLKLPQLEDYRSTGDHGLPYMERSKRDPNYDHKVETK